MLDDLGTHAGALTYGAILSIPPLLVFSMSILGVLLAGSPSAQKAVIDALSSLVPSISRDRRRGSWSRRCRLRSSGKLSFGVVGLIGLLWSASGLAARFRHALGLIFGTARTGLWTGRIVGSLIGVLVVVSLAAWQSCRASRPGRTGHGRTGSSRGSGFQLVILFGQFAFVLLIVPGADAGNGTPHARPPARDGRVRRRIRGAGRPRRHLLRYVVSKSSALYGTLGSLFGVVAFLYSAAWLVLLGAEVSAFRWESRRM